MLNQRHKESYPIQIIFFLKKICIKAYLLFPTWNDEMAKHIFQVQALWTSDINIFFRRETKLGRKQTKRVNIGA